jgi:peptidyl-dipeptidase A
MPAHLLGNMWAQSWGNIYDLVAPPDADPGYDVTQRLVEEGYDALGMTRAAERFFSSLGLEPLPATFWERSMFTQPRDRDVVCHASAWNIDDDQDLRIKMCIDVNAEDFQVIHHELGHNYYQRAYRHQPFLFRGSANDGFHEALGDAVALSVTPDYLRDIGLIRTVPPPDADLGLLMRDALDKVAFLPFGLLVDQWRWRVFSGDIGPDAYNRGWWELRRQYQGVVAPVRGPRPISIRAPSTTSPPTCPTPGTSWPPSYSSSSTGPCARWRATTARCTAAPSTGTVRPAPASRP